MDQVDSLEGWVAVKNNPFVDDLLPPRLTFLVAWNGVESKIAVTCRSSSRTVSDKSDDKTRFGYFSYQELKGIHEMLCLIHPSLSPHLPALPEQPVGLMAYISSVPVPDDVEKLCHDLTTYFNLALEICKEKLLISTLFEDPNYDDYFESVGELRRQGYLEQIANSEEEIKNVIFERDNCVTMQEMENVYDVEDDAVFRLNIVLAEYFNYQIQPFLDLREVSFNKLKEAKNNLLNPDLGERVRKENVEAIAEWQEHYEQSLDSIQDIYIKYYTRTSQVYTDMCDRMNEDKTRFGKKAFDIVGTDRLFRIEENTCLERMQLFLNSKKWCVQERDKVKQEIASLDESPAVRKEVQLLENHIYRWQIRIYDEHLKIFSEEEKWTKCLLRARYHKIDEVNEEVLFYDAVEDLDEMSEEDDVDECDLKTDPEILKLKRRLADINRRRAIVRNRKSTLERQCKEKQEERKNYIDTFNHHHSIQMKRDKDKEILEMKKDFIQEQRKRTIERLKSHKVKYPTPPTIKPLRYQPPSLRKDSLTSLSRRNPPSLSSNYGKKQYNEYPSLHPIKESKGKKTPVKRKPFVRPQKKKQDNVDGDVTFYISGGTVMNHNVASAQDGGSDVVGDSGSTQVTSTPSSNVPPPPPMNIPLPPPINIPPPPPINIPPPPPINLMPSLSNSKPMSDAPKPPPLGLGNLAEAMKNLKKAEVTTDTTKTGSGGLDLSSITAGRIHLKPASQRTLKPVKKDPNDLNEIFNMIKQGVKLRPVKSIDQSKSPSMSQSFPSDTHISLLQESMRRINNMVRGNTPESETSDDNSDFDD
ncbi:hypothetical protein LOTGIDRAFT_152402 [Lottia gigantea]|uniref:WH2 domain-containing protein n=1 Tax=Lottia gigantea TaxID=225164 RepID=V4BI12_LOTGI|nr:hypothetical protein LOTGIDRAFT_152402 [Lottia gigantea]ESP05547.1 hypothetical protein LOTGIDRAFT_152402 [Lottia gigantea]